MDKDEVDAQDIQADRRMSTVEVCDGFVEFRNHRIWYRIVEPEYRSPSALPLLCLHGGPGIPHDYLEPLEAIATTGRPVIFYDQLGCGNSDRSSDLTIYSIEYFKQELAFIRSALGLDKLHLFGQSWGGCLALEHVLEQPEGICSLILSSTPANVRQFVEEAYRLMNELPEEVRQVIQQAEAIGMTQSPDYQAAMKQFNHHYLCRIDPFPDCLQRAYAKAGHDFRGVGKIIDWDVTSRLNAVQLPTLLLSGRHDEVTPACIEVLNRGIAKSDWVLFEYSSHMPHLEEPERFFQVLTTFLARMDVVP